MSHGSSRNIKLFLLTAGLGLCIMCAGPLREIVLEPRDVFMDDAFVFSDNRDNLPNSNWGGNHQLFIASRVRGNAGYNRHTFIKFEGGKIASSPDEVLSVKMRLADISFPLLKDYTVNDVMMIVYRVMEPWSEGSAGKAAQSGQYPNAGNAISWNSQPRFDTTREWARVQLRPWTQMTMVNADITDLVRAWLAGTYPNHGLVLVGEQEGVATYIHNFASTEHPNASLRPRLMVVKAAPR